MAYVHSVYAPVTARLVQHFSRPGSWHAIRDVLDLLPGPALEEVQPMPPGVRPAPRAAGSKGAAAADGAKATTLVLFVGGCTYAEISALR